MSSNNFMFGYVCFQFWFLAFLTNNVVTLGSLSGAVLRPIGEQYRVLCAAVIHVNPTLP